MKLSKDNGCVYLIRNKDNGLLKIGYTNNIERRFKEIQKRFEFTGMKPQLEIEHLFENEDYIGLETYLHREFKEHRVQNEWFDIEDIKAVIEKASEFIPREKEEKEDKIKTVDYLVSKGYSLELAESLQKIFISLRWIFITDDLEDNDTEIIEELVSYIEMTEEEFKQAIEDELYSEEPERVFFNGLAKPFPFCYKVESMILIYQLIYDKEPYDHIEFDIKNTYISYIFSKENEQPRKLTSEVTVNDLDLWDLHWILEFGVDTRKHFFKKLTEEEIEAEKAREASRKSRSRRTRIAIESLRQ